MTREELLARARRELWAAWALSQEEMGSQAADTLYGLGMLVAPGEAAELVRLRKRVAELTAERHTTNAALADVTVALREAEDIQAQGESGTLAAWLYRRFVPVAGATAWESLTDGDRAYWEHQARAVQRAVRGGFKALTPVAEDVAPQVQKLRSLLAGQRDAVDGEHYASVHHAYKIPHDLPPLDGAL